MKYPSAVVALAFSGLLAGCTMKPEQPPLPPPTAELPKKQVPEYLENSVWQHVDLANADPLRVSGFGLVVNLSGTGDTRAPNAVRDYMIKQMQKHGFGSAVQTGYERIGPEQVLNDPGKRTAIVRVDGFIPPGARKGQLFDVQVSALQNSNTTSLHRGVLYETDLSPRGADAMAPGAGNINPHARVSGPIFVNPEAAIDPESATPNQRLSLRHGVLMGRGLVLEERPLVLKLRQPETRLARMIEFRVNERFQDSKVARAQNESEIFITVPAKYAHDWEHFAGVVLHLFYNPSNEFAQVKAKQMAEVAERDRENAPLMNISYAWEGLGTAALPAIRPLLTSDSAAVAFAAARAAANLEDPLGVRALAVMAQRSDHPFQLNAIRTLAVLPPTAQTATVLRDLLDTDQSLARIEAYKALIAIDDRSVLSRSIREKFVLDILPSKGPPLIYATRVGTPRIALIGRPSRIATPITFLTMANHFTIVSDPKLGALNLFYRGQANESEVRMQSPPDLGVVIAKMGGEGEPGENGRFNFGYGDIVAVIDQLARQKRIVAMDPERRLELVASFKLQELPAIEDPILNAPSIATVEQRPQDAPDAPDPSAPSPALPSPASGVGRPQ